MKTAYSFRFINLMTAVLALLLLGSCEQGTQSNTATIKIKLPSEFLANNNNGTVQPAAISGKPIDINRIIIAVTSQGNELGSADILKAGGTLSFEVPAFTELTVSGFAYAGKIMRYRGSTSIGPLQPGSQNPVRLTLNSINGVGGSIIIDGIVPASGTVSLFEVDNAGNTVGAARATATVENGEFALEIPPAIIPKSRYVIRSTFNGMTVESRYVDSGAIEVSAVTHATSLLVSELAGMALNGLEDISVQEIKEIQQTLQNIKNLKPPFAPNGEITIDDYAQQLIQTLKSDIEASAVATSSIGSNEICGQVLDSNESPVGGIDIVAHDFATFMLQARTTTDENGAYCLNVHASGESDPFTDFQNSGEYILGAINRSSSTNNTTNAGQWWTQNGGAVSRIEAGKITFSEVSPITKDFTLPPGARILGTVGVATDGGTQPLPGITIIVREKTSLYLVAAVKTDANGSYLLKVPVGQYVIEARNNTPQGYASETYAGSGGTNNLNTAEVVTLIENDVFTADFNLQSGVELRGSISDGVNPIVGGTVFIDNDEEGAATRLRVTQKDGSYTVWLRPDVYEVYSHGQSQSVDLTLGPLQNPIAFSSSIATLPLKLQHNGTGVSKAKARLYFDDDGSYVFKSIDFSKDDGTLTLYSDTAGSHVVVVQVLGEEPYASTVYMDQTQRQLGTSIPLTLDQTEQELAVNSPDAGLLRGIVTSDGTTPLANVGVVVRQGGINQNNFFVSTRTRSDGSYALSLPGGITYDAVHFVSSDNSFAEFNCDMILVNTGSTTQLDVNTSPEPSCIGGVPLENLPPVADAGSDRSVSVNTTVILDGSNSSDVNGNDLTYSWSISSSPQGSETSLTNPTTATPSFIPDQLGDYVVQLIVNDGQLDSTPVTVTISAINDPPTADAGPDQTVTVQHTVTLDGSASSDVNSDTLTYSWSFVSTPVESSVTLSDPTIANPTFTPDLLGNYVLQLVVNDGLVDSEPSTVTITAEPATVRLQLINTSLVGVSRSAQLSVILTDPAPVGGVTVTITSDDSGILSLGEVSTVFIPAGETTSQITVYGVTQGTTTLRANATGYVEGTLDVNVTLNLISIPTTLNVPLGQTVSFPVSIAPDPAPAGGVVIDLVSIDPATAQLLTSTVTIPEGTNSANASITGNAIGSTVINASNPNYAADSGEVNVTAELNIIPTSTTLSAGFPIDITVRLQSLGSDVAAPAPISVNLTPTDPSCVAVTSPISIDTGFVSAIATIDYAGTADLPCNTTVTASATSITPDTINITVNPTPVLKFQYSPMTVGAGLMPFYDTNNWINLGFSNHGGVTIRIQSSNPAVALVSPNGSTAGSEFIDVFVPDGQNYAYFVPQGVEGAPTPSSVTFTASSPGFIDGTGTVDVVQPALRITSLNANTTTLSVNDPFTVDVGIPTANNSDVSVQRVRSGGNTLRASIESTLPTVGQLVTSTATGSPVTVDIQPGQYRSPTTVEAGGVAFDPLEGGNTTVVASISGFITTPPGSVDITVAAPVLSFQYSPITVGAGLMPYYDTSNWVNLGATGHGGVTIRIQSSNPAVALVSPNGSTAGSEFIDVFVPDGQNYAYFVPQGVEGAPTPSSVTFTASSPGFIDGTGTVDVVQPALRITSLNANTTTLSVDDPFTVDVGIPTANNANVNVQRVRSGGSTLSASIESTLPTVGQLVTSTTTGKQVTVEIQPGQYQSPTTVVAGGVAFNPLTTGDTTVVATISGFITTTSGSVNMTVSAPPLSFQYSPITVGAGLMLLYDSSNWVNLGATDHGGVTVHIQSSNPGVALISPNGSTAGTESIDIFVPNGQGYAYFVAQGVEGAPTPSSVSFTVSAPGFTDGTGTVEVVQPALRISALNASTTTSSPNDPFTVDVGIPTTNNANVTVQRVRSGNSSLSVSVESSTPSVGQLVTSIATGSPVTIEIQPGQYRSPTTVETGGVAFDPLTNGTSTVSATIQGFIATDAASVVVNVTP